MENAVQKAQRKIIHIDMDAFYASVEQRDNPSFHGKAIAVGGSPEGRGVVATASYEARKFGIHSAMSSRKALQLCPEIIFIRPRFAVYKEISLQIREIFHRYTDIIEPLSLDEAFLDVSDDKLKIGSAIQIAKDIKSSIKDELRLSASAGISINKFVAKIASDINKPNGLTFIGPSGIESFMENLPVEKFFGVGKVTASKMKKMGLHKGADLKALSEGEMTRHFGKVGRFFYNIVRGIDDRPVQTMRERKSLSAEATFPDDLHNIEEMYAEIDKIAKIVSRRLCQHELRGSTVNLKIKYSNFKLISRNQSLAAPINDHMSIAVVSKKLLTSTDLAGKRIRLLGIGLSNFRESNLQNVGGKQLKLF